jgi:hypothetical protein
MVSAEYGSCLHSIVEDESIALTIEEIAGASPGPAARIDVTS